MYTRKLNDLEYVSTLHVHVVTYMYMYTCTCTPEVLITFEVWAKLAQQWLVCVIHFESINKELMLLMT